MVTITETRPIQCNDCMNADQNPCLETACPLIEVAVSLPDDEPQPSTWSTPVWILVVLAMLLAIGFVGGLDCGTITVPCPW